MVDLYPSRDFWESDLEMPITHLLSNFQSETICRNWLFSLSGRQLNVIFRQLIKNNDDISLQQKRAILMDCPGSLLHYYLLSHFNHSKCQSAIAEVAKSALNEELVSQFLCKNNKYDKKSLIFLLFHRSPSRVDVTIGGQKLKRGIKLWPVGVSILKSELFQLLNILKDEEEEKVPPGYCHFPQYPPEYFKQLTAEQLITKVVKGYTKQEWQKTRDRNEVLDCRIYARAASIALGIDRWPESKWESLMGEKTKKVKKLRKSKWLGEKN